MEGFITYNRSFRVVYSNLYTKNDLLGFIGVKNFLIRVRYKTRPVLRTQAIGLNVSSP